MVKVIRQVSHGEEMRVPDPRPQAIPTTPDLRALWGQKPLKGAQVWEVAFSDLGWGRHEAGEPKKKAGWLGAGNGVSLYWPKTAHSLALLSLAGSLGLFREALHTARHFPARLTRSKTKPTQQQPVSTGWEVRRR